MDKQILEIIDSKNKLFLKNKKYILDNDWSFSAVSYKKGKEDYKAFKDSITYKQKEFQIQNTIIVGMLQHINRFLKKIKSVEVNEDIKKFLDDSLEVIELHIKRVDNYVDNIDISEIENMDIRSDELQFHNTISKEVELIQDKVTEYGLRSSKIADTSSIVFLNDVKAPLSMHWILSGLYPEINKVLEEKGVDIDNPPLNNEMLINMENVPVWDTKLHYWEQKKETLIFYATEFYKLKNGINIDGVYISGWAYYHMNVFVTPIPHKVWNPFKNGYDSKDIIMNPPLRDSDWMLFENRVNQEKNKIPFMFVAATRRAAKTTGEASMLGHAATIGKKELLCAGSNARDLGQLAKNFKIDTMNKNPAFAIYNVSNDWDKKVELGIKRKDQRTIPLSTLHIINTDDGNNKEVFAGYTPDLVVIDEAMKSAFIEALEGLLPAMKGIDDTIRAFGMLSGTGGTSALSADGFKVLSDPDTYEVLPMNWDILERKIPDKFITWKEDRKKPFGTFIPGQCRVDMPKIESTLEDYLDINSKELKKIKIKLTDWEKAVVNIKEKREKVEKDKIKHQKEVVYCPLSPSEIFMSGALNPFSVEEAKLHKQYLLETGKWDRRRELIRNSNGKIEVHLSKKDLSEFPHKGGNIDAPFLIFEDPPLDPPKWGTYVAGFDDYKHDSSDSNSVGTFYIWKNDIIGDPFSKKLVASLATRPINHSSLHEKWLMLMESYHLNDTCFGENEDFTIKDYLDRRHLTDKYLAQNLDFTQAFTLPNNLKRKYGWSPQTSKKTLFNLFVDYCNETFEAEDEDGNIITLKGVQRIDDIGLLDEIINWGENINVDRITAAMGAVGYMHYLGSSYKWKPYSSKKVNSEKTVEENKTKERVKAFYGMSSRKAGFYRRR